jgi:hypothetical protein
VAVCLVPASALAQAAATGRIIGRITDSSGGVLPGVTVSLKSPEVLGAFTGVTDEQGQYRISNLPPAEYEARAELQGFQSVVQKVNVRLGATLTVDFTMPVGALEETVQVSGEAPIVDSERAGVAVNINNTALTTVPISTQRRYQDVWALVPGVYVRPDQQDVNPSVNSRGTSENSTKLDGMDVTDPFGGGVYSTNFNFDAIQDIQVKTLGAEAEDGARTGGFMSIVTKSGSNTLSGSAAFFYIPESFNSSNVQGVPANQRSDKQPEFTLGGPIAKDRIWFFGSYRRIQEDQTLNNAPVPRERRGNLAYVKITTQFNASHRMSVQWQYDKTRLKNAVLRSSAVGASSTTGGLSSATLQLAKPESFGDTLVGGPLLGVNYTWVVNSTSLFQFIGSWMINKPQDAEPSGDFGATRVIQTNAAGDITGSLTTIAQEGSFGVNDSSDRSMLYLYPSYSFYVDKWGSHDFKTGFEFYPDLRNKTRRDITPVEFYFRPPGTTGSADRLFERQTFRNLVDGSALVENEAWEKIYAFYVQDRWKPRPNISVKAGVRIDSNHIWTRDREKVLTPLLPAGFPTDTSDKEFDQTTTAPNFGIAWDVGKWGVFRGTAGRYYEWLDLGGGDGSTHFPYVVATDIVRASPRSLAPTLNQAIQGPFPLGVAYGPDKKKTYTNEFSLGWERRLPGSSSLGITFLLKNTWDFQTSEDKNVIRNPTTGALVDRPFPAYDNVNATRSADEFSHQEFRSVQLLYTKNFAGLWGINASYWYGFHSSVRTAFNPTTETFQFLGFKPEDLTNDWVSPRHQARLSGFVRLPFDVSLSVLYTATQGPRTNVTTGDFPLNATAPRVTLSNGRIVADPFFNPAYPRARKNNVDMLAADNAHIVNLRLQKSFKLGGNRRLDLSGDVFNLLNSDAAFGFLSADARSANFGRKTNYVQPRVGQVGARFVF